MLTMKSQKRGNPARMKTVHGLKLKEPSPSNQHQHLSVVHFELFFWGEPIIRST